MVHPTGPKSVWVFLWASGPSSLTTTNSIQNTPLEKTLNGGEESKPTLTAPSRRAIEVRAANPFQRDGPSPEG
ncbi:unnamed protein product [Lasius platythorax]|uniref:Uncharacterized protein n=1 Tax=Lasius platythorax TaxID=488582 RepID=A0AAV2N0L8_9HYME